MRYTLLVVTVLLGIVCYGEAMGVKFKMIERNTHIERMLE